MNWESTDPADTKASYLAELASLLDSLPEEEREEALTYYTEYFDDAGPGQAERVLQELGPAKQLAAQILSGYGRDYLDAEPKSSSERVPARPEDAAQARAREEAEQAEERERQRRAVAAERAKAEEAKQAQATEERPQSRSGGTSFLLILLIIVTFPIWLPLLLAVLGVAIAGFAVVLGLLVAAIAMTAGFLIGGVALSISGIPMLFIAFWDGLITLSGGLVLIGLALLAILLAYVVCFKLLPAAMRLIVRVLQWPLQRRGGARA